jgi:hypothetical protein
VNAATIRGLAAISGLLLIGGFLAARAFAADAPGAPLATSLGSGSVLWLEGKSTLHDFESKTSQSTLTLTRDPAAAAPTDVAGFESLIRSSGVRSLDLEVPVLTLKSEKSGLDKNLYKSLKAEEHPSIRFHLTQYEIEPASGDTLRVHARGTLDIAGAQRPDTLDARVYRAPQGLWLEGSEPLLMSDFGIKPPTMMLGTVKVADRIVVRYRLLMVPKVEGTASAPSRVN